MLNQESNFLRDHSRLARARARDHQAGPFGVMNGFELGNIELGWGRHLASKNRKEDSKRRVRAGLLGRNS